MKWANRQHGFTIVELLIVVVVIAILAAITIVAYTGIQQRATASSVQSEVEQTVKKAETLKATSTNDSYPATQAELGLPASSNDLRYTYDSGTNTYCIQSKKNNASYFATSINPAPRPGLCINAPESMLGWWKFNNSTVDDSVNASTSTPTGLTAAVGQNGQANQSYGFDGTTSSLQIPSSTSLSASMQSVSFWVYPTSLSGNRVFIAARPSSTSGWMIGHISAAATFDCGTSANRYNSGVTLPVNTWTHLVAVCTQSGTVAMYINGVAAGSGASVNRSSIATSASLFIGRDSSSAQYYISGSIDDVRIYTRALTATDAQDLFAQGAL